MTPARFTTDPELPAMLGVILAGGLGRRMGGGDKPLRRLGGVTLLEHVARRLGPQVDGLLLNANGDPERFPGHFVAGCLAVVPDGLPDHPGPLAGILAALDWAATNRVATNRAAGRPVVDWVVSVPGDTPFLPPDLVARLWAARRAAGVPMACASSGGRAHPPVGLWPVSLRETLREALLRGERRVSRFTAGPGCAEAEWPALPFDPFFNANTPEDMLLAEAALARGVAG